MVKHIEQIRIRHPSARHIGHNSIRIDGVFLYHTDIYGGHITVKCRHPVHIAVIIGNLRSGRRSRRHRVNKGHLLGHRVIDLRAVQLHMLPVVAYRIGKYDRKHDQAR